MQFTKSARCLLAAAGLAAASLAGTASAQTAFTYQGVLEESGSPVTGLENIRFRIYTAQAGGTLVGETTQNVDVADGVFSTQLNFGPLNTIDPASTWLEIAVDSDGMGSFVTLGRQQITAAPFSTNTRGLNVDSSGRVSIGTTSHEDILHVTGNNARILTESTSGFFSGIRSRLAGREYFTGVDSYPGAAGAGWHVFDNSVGGGRRLALIPNGNFGIGTSSPNARLHVESDNIDVAYFRSNNTANGRTSLRIYDPNDTSGLIVHKWEDRGGFRMAEEGIPLVFDTKDVGQSLASEKMRIAANGNVGIGTTTPDTTLDVAGKGTFDSGVDAGGRSRFGFLGFPEISATVDIVGRSEDTFALVVEDPSGIYRFSVSNNGNVATQCGIICASDERLKDDITNLQTPLDKIMALRSVSFTWKDETLAKRGTQLGFVAQEVQQVLPELIGETPDGFLGVDYASLTSVLTGAVQEQQAEIEIMQGQIAALQAEMESLQNQRSMTGASMVWPVLLGGGLLGGFVVARRRTAKA